MLVEEIVAKTLIHDTLHKTQYHLNPYQGCFHDCKYCNGKSKKFYMHDEFSTNIKVKVNAPQLLEDFLRKKGFFPTNREQTETLFDFVPNLTIPTDSNLPPKFTLFIGGGICDVYQPAEKTHQITRKLLQIAYDFKFPIRTLTKNILALRDIELFKTIHKQSFARVSFTATLANEHVQKIFEPNASTTEDRFHALKRLRDEGLPAGIYMTPLLPFIGDTQNNIEELFRKCKDSDAEFVITGGLSLRPGKHKEELLSVVKEYYPEHLENYVKLYLNDHPSGAPDTFYSHKLKLVDPISIGYNLSKKYNIPFFEPRYIPNDKLQLNRRISTVLLRIAFLKSRILRNSSLEAKRLQQDSILFETLTKDIGKMDNKKVHSLPIHKEAIPHVLNMLENNECEYLIQHNEWDNLFFQQK